MAYTSTHNHTEYSNLKLIDSINKPEELLQYGYDIGLRGVAITDHDCISGHVRAWNYYNKHFTAEQQEQFKLILGNEIYLCRSDLSAKTHQKGERFYHLILLAKDNIGYEQIRKISSRSWGRAYMRNIMRTPTFSEDLYEIIGANKGHVIATTACLGGYCGVKFEAGELTAIENHLQMMSELFGKNDFYIELQPSKQATQINYNNYMINKYWGTYSFIFATDSHYLKEEDRQIHKIVLNSKSSGDREVDSFYSSAYMMTEEEVKQYFFAQGIEQDKFTVMANNTNNIADQVSSYTLKKTSVIPKIMYDEHQVIDNFFVDLMKNYPEETQYIAKVIEENNSADIYLLNLLVKPWQTEIVAAKKNEKKYVVELDYEFEQLYKISHQLNQAMSNYFITMSKMIDIMWEEADSFVGPGRGSAGSSLINSLLGITQIDPQEQPIELPFWRFIHADRPGLPDIDIDTEATKRVAVFNKVQAYFQSIGGDLIHVCTFGTEKTKGAINVAVKGLELDDAIGSYLTSMIPNARGNDWTLSQCYYGDEEHPAIANFKAEIDKYPLLFTTAKKIEGMITNLGCHASGVLALNEPIWTSNSVMKTSSGVAVTAFDLEDTEQLGGVKYDYLTVQALDKIRVCFNWLLEDERIEWQGSLRETYNKYLAPKSINYDNKEMWEALYNHQIPSCFQFDTLVGSQAVQQIHPESLAELVAGNGLMRLMANEDGDLPLDIYVKHKNDEQLWFDEMDAAGLTKEEQQTLMPYLSIVNGVAVSQECMMRMSMDKHIANFTIGEANILRKGVAKKKADVLQKGKELFYTKGLEAGTRQEFLDYVWNKQIMLQAGYSFSDIHAVAYSYIALQEMNLGYFFPSIYWKTACLSVDAGAVNDEDFYNLVNLGIIQLADEDDRRDQSKVKYGKIATAIIKFKQFGNIELPDINSSRFGFTPDTKNNAIRYGLRGISRVGEKIIQDIIINRPYTSLQDFCNKMISSDGKKLISKDKIINLIKAGAFNNIEHKTTDDILHDYVLSVSNQKEKLNLQNFQMLINKNLIPKHLEFTAKVYNFTKYIREMRFMGNYILDDKNGMRFYSAYYDMTKVKQLEINGTVINVISDKYWDAIYDKEMDKARAFIKENQYQLLLQLNDSLFNDEDMKYASGDSLNWELTALNFYYSGHPLTNLQLPIEITRVSDLQENEFDGTFWKIKGKMIPKRILRTIVGTVIDKDKTKSIITLQTPDGVIDVKIAKQQFARYAHEISETTKEENNIVEDSFFEKGTHLVVTGYLRGEVFTPKVYKETGFDCILKIMLNSQGELDYLMRKSE